MFFKLLAAIRENPMAAMVGRTFASVEAGADGEALTFTDTDGFVFKFEHFQDCCESVRIEDVCGDLNDLVGLPLLTAEEVVSHMGEEPHAGYDESWTWTFYKFATTKGSVTVRWLGESNGYYSERVDLRVTGPDGVAQ